MITLGFCDRFTARRDRGKHISRIETFDLQW